MNKSQIYANRSVGVLGDMSEERSARDREMIILYNQCKQSREGFDPNSGAGVTEIPAEYAQGWEQRSQADQQMLKMYNPCGKEGFEYANISDNPYNPYNNTAYRIPSNQIASHQMPSQQM